MAVFNSSGSSHVNNSTVLSNPNSGEISINTNSNDDDVEIKYPLNTKPLESQVAGHAFEDGKCTVGMLKHSDGYILKPVNRPIQGEREIKFYEEMQKTVDPLLLEFKKFIPEYYGTTVSDLQGKKVTFLLLKDIANGCDEPCLMDIKIGKQTWEPGAPEEKQLSEQKKYAECKKNLCFCIPGFQAYDIKTGHFQKYGKDFGKKLDVKGVYDAFKTFFNAKHGVGAYALAPMLFKLKEILNWWKKQNVFHIYASSVLLAYDAAFVRKTVYSDNNGIKVILPIHMNYELNSNHEVNATASTLNIESRIFVYLIDFAHVIPANQNSPDLNYIEGLQSLINVFESLLTEFRLQKVDKKVESS